MADQIKSFFKNLFTQNIGWKLLSLILGFLVWSFLSNAQDPIVTKVVNVPVTYLNADLLLEQEQLVFMSGPDTVAITVSTRKSRQNEVTAAIFSCKADLVDHAGGDVSSQRVHISVTEIEANEALLDWSYPKNDPNVTVVMDNYITKNFDVTIKTEDSMVDGLILGDSLTMNPTSVSVSGPSTLFSNLSEVVALVNMRELSEQGSGQISYDVALTLYDANDQEITDKSLLTLSQDTVTLSANVLCLQTVRVVIMGVTGTPEEGYRYVSNTITNGGTLTVSGLKSTVADLSEIYIPATDINIDGISTDTTYSLDVTKYLPSQVSLISGGTVTVTVKVEQLDTKEFTIQNSDITLVGADTLTYSYSIVTTKLKIQVKGFKEDLDVLASRLSELNPQVNVEGYTAGVYALPVTVNELDGYYFDNLDELEVYVMIEAVPESSASESETESTAKESESESAGETSTESESESESYE